MHFSLTSTINQMFVGFSQLPTTAEHVVMKSLSTVQTKKLLGSSRRLGGAAEHLINCSEKRIFSV